MKTISSHHRVIYSKANKSFIAVIGFHKSYLLTVWYNIICKYNLFFSPENLLSLYMHLCMLTHLCIIIFLNHQLQTVSSHHWLSLVFLALWYPGYADRRAFFLLSQTSWVMEIVETKSISHCSSRAVRIPHTTHPIPPTKIWDRWWMRRAICSHILVCFKI